MSLFCCIQLLVCFCPALLQGARINTQNAVGREPETSPSGPERKKRRRYSDYDAFPEPEPERQFLACQDAKSGRRVIIAEADKQFWEYYFEKGKYFTQYSLTRRKDTAEEGIPSPSIESLERYRSSLRCRALEMPAKPIYALAKTFPDDILGLIDSKIEPPVLKCDGCWAVIFPPDVIEKCSAAEDINDFNRIQAEVESRGADCKVEGFAIPVPGDVSKCVTPTSARRTAKFRRTHSSDYKYCLLDERIEKLIRGPEEKIDALKKDIHALNFP